MLDCAECGRTPKRYIIAEDGRAYCPECLRQIDVEQYEDYKDEVKENVDTEQSDH